jgi:hypothetical protein
MKRLFLVLVSAAALWSSACSGGGGTTILPPPTGKFGQSSLNGTYAFVTNGEVFNGTVSSLSRTGSFIANGSGQILGGIEDVVVFGVGQTLGATITGGSYIVNADGTGNVSLNATANGVPSTITFGITLTSTSAGLLIDETFNQSQQSTGSGNFFQQNAADCSNPVGSVSGSYIFDFSGLDASNNPESLVGQFVVNGGVITTGLTDANDGGVLSSGSIGVGSFSTDPQIAAGPNSCGRGLATIGGQTYEYYVVDATRIRFISTDTGAMLTGDAFVQTNTIPTSASALNSNFAFLVAGTSANGFITRVGRFSTNGTTVTNALVDTNDGAVKFTQTSVANPSNASVTYDPTTGRGTVTFKDPNLAIPFSFVFYLSSAIQGVIQETTLASNTALGAVDVADGSFDAQTGNPFSGSNITGTYAMNWTGLSVQNGVQDEEDLVGRATISNLGISGAADIFQFQSTFGPSTGNLLGGTITIPGDGAGDDLKRNMMAVTLTKNGTTVTVNCVVYFVNPQLAFFANTNASANRDIVGVLQLQP